MHYRRLFITIGLALPLMLLVFSFGFAQQSPTFRIGVLDNPAGPIITGVQLAIQQINASGGVRGADGTQFQLMAVLQSPDSSGSYQRAIINLSTANIVALIGPETSAAVQANLSGLLALNRPILTPALANGLVLDDNTDLLFRSRARGLLIDRALADTLVRELGARNIKNVLLDQDPEHLEGLVGFSTAAQELGAATLDPIIEAPSDALIQSLVSANPDAVVLFGAPALANEVVIGLRNARYTGLIAYNHAEHPQFRDLLAPTYLDGIISAQSWSYALSDEASSQFTLDYVRATGLAPSALSAAAYDSTLLIAEALELPGELKQNLSRLEARAGVQGSIAPNALPLGETSDTVVVVRHLFGGGQDALTRYASERRITDGLSEENSLVIVRATPTPTIPPTPTPTATPDGVYGTVLSQVLNVRTGPGTNYDILGQLRQNESVRIIGANINFTWAVIEFRGQQAWISTEANLLRIEGDRRSVPVITPPPSPTPGPTSTPAPTATLTTADLVITGVSPAILSWNTPSTVIVTVLNGGGTQSGGFTIAGGFAPGPVVGAASAPAPGLAPGQTGNYPITVTVTGATGYYSAPITVDYLGEVTEGAGESNNTIDFAYKLDRLTLFQGTTTIPNGGGFNLDGSGGNDITYSGGVLSVTCPTCLGTLSTAGFSFDTAHHDIVFSSVNSASLVGLTPGLVLAIKTDGTKYAVLRVEAADGANLTFTYRVYQ